MLKIKQISTAALLTLLYSATAVAENIGGGSPDSQSLFAQAWALLFG